MLSNVLAAGHTRSGCSISSLAFSLRAPQEGCLARSTRIAFSIGSSVACEQVCGRRLREACLPAEAEPLYLEAEAIYRQQGEEAELDLANTLRGLALVNESSGRSDAARLLFQQARELYAKCKVEAGVAGCNEKLSQ